MWQWSELHSVKSREQNKTCDIVESLMEIPWRCYRFLRSATKHLKLVNQIEREEKEEKNNFKLFISRFHRVMIQRDSFMTLRFSLVTLQRPMITKFSRLFSFFYWKKKKINKPRWSRLERKKNLLSHETIRENHSAMSRIVWLTSKFSFMSCTHSCCDCPSSVDHGHRPLRALRVLALWECCRPPGVSRTSTLRQGSSSPNWESRR